MKPTLHANRICDRGKTVTMEHPLLTVIDENGINQIQTHRQPVTPWTPHSA